MFRDFCRTGVVMGRRVPILAAMAAPLVLVVEGCALLAGLGDTPLPELSTDGSPGGSASGDASVNSDSSDASVNSDSSDASVTTDSSDASVTTDSSDASVTTDSSDASSPTDATDSTVPGDAADASDASANTVADIEAPDAGEIPPEAANANPMGYRRSDGVSAIVYRTALGHVVELESSGSYWIPRDLSQLGGATTTALGDPFGFVRADGTNGVVYLGADDNVHYIEQVSSGWTDSSLAVAAGTSGVAVGNPYAYLRSDRMSAVVYATADGDIHELTLASRGWTDLDISAAVGAPAAASDPVGFVRSDLVNSTIFRSLDNHIYEISAPQMDAGARQLTDLTAATRCVVAHGKPHPYLDADGYTLIAFRDSASTTPSVRGIALVSGTWACYDLTANSDHPSLWATGGDPVPWVRSDNVDSLVYRASDDHVIEMSVHAGGVTWLANDLSELADASAAASDPMGYVRADSTNAIVFRTRGDNLTRQMVLVPYVGWVNADPRAQ